MIFNRQHPSRLRVSQRAFRLKQFFFFLSLTLTLSAFPASARTLPVNLAEMTANAGWVVHGRVAEVRIGRHPEYNNIQVTFITLDVIEMLKGSASRQFTFMQFSGGNGTVHNFHLPQYTVGEEVVLFLYPESRYGFTSPIGEGQGKFLVRDDPRRGQRALVNEQNNLALFENLDVAKLQSRLALSKAERGLMAQRSGAVELDSFRSLVRKLAVSKRAAN